MSLIVSGIYIYLYNTYWFLKVANCYIYVLKGFIYIKYTYRQNTFRPVFAPLLRLANPERKRVTQLRRLLADGGFLYDTLKEAWQEQQVAGKYIHTYIHLIYHV